MGAYTTCCRQWQTCPVRMVGFFFFMNEFFFVRFFVTCDFAIERKRERDEDLLVADDEAHDSGGNSPLEQWREDLARLRTLRFPELQTLLDECNSFTKRHGYPKLYKNIQRDNAAYFYCSCNREKCFLLTFARTEAAAKGSRKQARDWIIKSVGAHVCEPHEPRVVAIANTWIPDEIKAHLVLLLDLDVGAPDAHRQAIEFASGRHLSTTWEASDVKALFVALQALVSVTDTIPQLQALADQGHFVSVDIKVLPGEKRVLNMAFVATKSMQRLARIFSFFGTLDSTYGKNKLQLPVQFFVGQTNEGLIVPFGVGFMRAETKDNYKWLLQAYYRCYKTLPGVLIVDGDPKLREAIAEVAAHHKLLVVVLLCVWHLFNDLEKNLVKKTPGVDAFRLKADFYKLRALASVAEFDTA